MGFRFRRSVQLFPGVRLNVGKRGLSATFGAPGASFNVGSRGGRATIGIPGTGLSYSTKLFGGEAPAVWQPSAPASAPAPARVIASASVDKLTSASLQDFKVMLQTAEAQRRDLTTAYADAVRSLERLRGKRRRRNLPIVRAFFGKAIRRIGEEMQAIAEEGDGIEEMLRATRIDIAFDDGEAHVGYGALVRAYDALTRCHIAWDITSDRQVNRAAERSAASVAVDRKPVKLEYGTNELLRFEGRALRFPNANGEDLLIYPGMMLLARPDGAFAIIDLREVKLSAVGQKFIEDGAIPPDSIDAGFAWLKSNKDGTPDRRFNGNRQIPVRVYGEIAFKSKSGLNELYQFSNPAAANEFGLAFHNYVALLAAAS